MFENPRRGRQARNFTTNVSKILDLKSSSEQIFFRKLSLGAPAESVRVEPGILILSPVGTAIEWGCNGLKKCHKGIERCERRRN